MALSALLRASDVHVIRPGFFPHRAAGTLAWLRMGQAAGFVCACSVRFTVPLAMQQGVNEG